MVAPRISRYAPARTCTPVPERSDYRVRGVPILWLLLVISAGPSLAQRVRQLTHVDRFEISEYLLDDAGSRAFFVSDIDPFGIHPRVVKQVFRTALPGGSVEQLTGLDHDVEELSVSDDGLTFVFRSSADPVGTNSDHSIELFFAEEGGGPVTQLTDDQGSGFPVISARISGDGNRVAFCWIATVAGVVSCGSIAWSLSCLTHEDRRHMTTRIALLRAVNVARHPHVRMSDLREPLVNLGFADLRSVVRTGNLVFSTRSVEQWSGVIANNPFPSETRRGPRRPNLSGPRSFKSGG